MQIRTLSKYFLMGDEFISVDQQQNKLAFWANMLAREQAELGSQTGEVCLETILPERVRVRMAFWQKTFKDNFSRLCSARILQQCGHYFAKRNFQKNMPASIKGIDKHGSIRCQWIGQFRTGCRFRPLTVSASVQKKLLFILNLLAGNTQVVIAQVFRKRN